MNTDQQEQLELKPCPFCGGKATIEQNKSNGYKLKCTSCLMGVTQKVLRNSMEWLKETMIKDWNTRVEPYTPLEDAGQRGEVDLKEFSRCINALALELPAPVWDDVYNRWLKLKSSIIKAQSSTPVQEGWVRVEDRLPEIGSYVIGYRPYAHTEGDDIITILKYEGGKSTDCMGVVHGFERQHHCTHWTPLPSPPGTIL